MLSAVILVGGKSSRMGEDKSLLNLSRKPLIAYVVEKLELIVDEIVIVVGTNSQKDAYYEYGARVVTDRPLGNTPLVGAYTGFLEVRGEYVFLCGGDMPIINPRVVKLLFTKVEGYNAATPTWPNGWVEPLHSVYHAKSAAQTSLHLIESGMRKLSLILYTLSDVNYIPISIIRKIDSKLLTLTDINTAQDLENIRELFKKKNKKIYSL